MKIAVMVGPKSNSTLVMVSCSLFSASETAKLVDHEIIEKHNAIGMADLKKLCTFYLLAGSAGIQAKPP